MSALRNNEHKALINDYEYYKVVPIMQIKLIEIEIKIENQNYKMDEDDVRTYPSLNNVPIGECGALLLIECDLR